MSRLGGAKFACSSVCCKVNVSCVRMDTDSANAMEGQTHHHSNTINEEKWENSYRRLKAFKEKHGHTQLSYRHNDDPKLGRWGTLNR